MYTATVFTTARTWKQPKCPLMDEWIKKMWYICRMEYYSATKKEWNNVICSNMDGARDCHTEWSQTKKDKYVISLICIILKNGTNELAYNTRVTDVGNKLTVTKKTSSMVSHCTWNKIKTIYWNQIGPSGALLGTNALLCPLFLVCKEKASAGSNRY